MSTNLLRKTALWVAAKTKAHAAESVVYWRETASVPISASIGETEQDVQDTDGFTVTNTSVDWLITAADLVLDDVTVLPEIGDLIKHTVGAKTFTYKVLPMDGDEKHWRYTEEITKTMLRVHTKFVGES
jgi:hypothetical protein